MGSEGGRPGSLTQAVRHTCSGKLGIVKILCYIVKKMFLTGSLHLWAMGALCLSIPKHNGKSGTDGIWDVFVITTLSFVVINW